jgi:hypothetical protein
MSMLKVGRLEKWTIAWANRGNDTAKSTSKIHDILGCASAGRPVSTTVIGKGKRYEFEEAVGKAEGALERRVKRKIETSWRSNRCRAETRS